MVHEDMFPPGAEASFIPEAPRSQLITYPPAPSAKLGPKEIWGLGGQPGLVKVFSQPDPGKTLIAMMMEDPSPLGSPLLYPRP